MIRPVACLLAATMAALLACSSGARDASSRKLVIVGFDGLDPDLTERWINEGKLPALARLASAGGLHRLETTHQADTAAAWASFATGVNPGKHRIFESTARDASTYGLHLALVERAPGRLLFDYVPIAPPATRARRRSTSFWVTAGEAGVRSSILSVPLTFPPEAVPNGELLAGFPLPDLSGSIGTYHYFASDVTPAQSGRSETGGLVQPLTFRGNHATAELIGPRDPAAHADDSRARRVPFTVTWNHEARSATIELDSETIHLLERQWSRWIEIDFTVNLLARLRGIVQFHLASAGQQLRLYVSPIHWHPAHPPAPMSSPESFARELHDRLGLVHTLGWPASSWALADGRLDEAAFLEDAERRFDDRAETILNRVESDDWDLLVGVVDATDHVQHVMWRLIDSSHPTYDYELARVHGSAIEHVYRRADQFVATLLTRLTPETTVMIVSAYGFAPFRTAVNLNSWLVERGYMTLRGPAAERKTLHDLSRASEFWGNVDWTKTRAYAVGLGQLFVNLSGREVHGVVAEGREYDQVLDSLIIDLLNFLDPRTQTRVVANVYKRGEIYSGPFVHEAGDLLVTFEPGYRVSLQTALGGTPPTSVGANLSKWSGDHISMDHRRMAGVLITNRRPAATAPRLIDIAPTVLRYFGLAVPSEVDGVPFY